MSDDDIKALRAGNDARRAAAEAVSIAVDTFYLEPVPDRILDPRIVDLCTITPFPMKVQEEALSRKVAEMEHNHRVLFREKIALFFGREADDIPSSEKSEPPPTASTEPG
jgi:hypothetical protein